MRDVGGLYETYHEQTRFDVEVVKKPHENGFAGGRGIIAVQREVLRKSS